MLQQPAYPPRRARAVSSGQRLVIGARIARQRRAGQHQERPQQIIADAARQQVTGEVTTAIALDGETLGRLVAELNRVTGKTIQLFQKIDPAILGGAIVKVGEQIIDGSLRRKLDQIQAKLAQ